MNIKLGHCYKVLCGILGCLWLCHSKLDAVADAHRNISRSFLQFSAPHQPYCSHLAKNAVSNSICRCRPGRPWQNPLKLARQMPHALNTADPAFIFCSGAPWYPMRVVLDMDQCPIMLSAFHCVLTLIFMSPPSGRRTHRKPTIRPNG